MAVQGFAGTGKTRMLNEVAALAGDRPVFGLAPSAAAARVLAVEGGIGATTLQRLLTRYREIAEGTATDGRDRAGPRDLPGRRRGGRRVLDGGDGADAGPAAHPGAAGRRPAGAGGGQPSAALGGGGPAVPPAAEGRHGDGADGRHVIRQRSVDLKAAVAHMVAGDPALAMESIAADVRELPQEALAGTAARLWLSLPPEAREGTIVLAPTHEMREEINAVVRRGLAEEGVLGRRSIEIGRLVDRRLTRVHAAEGANYRPGDVVVANRDVYGLGEGEAWTVSGVPTTARSAWSAGARTGRSARPATLRATSRSARSGRCRCARATRSSGPATSAAAGSSTASARRWRRSPRPGFTCGCIRGGRSASPTATTICATSTTPGARRSTGRRGSPRTT